MNLLIETVKKIVRPLFESPKEQPKVRKKKPKKIETWTIKLIE